MKDYYKTYKGVPVERMPDLTCGCRPEKLKEKFKEHMGWCHPINEQPFHCCKCYRPGNRSHITPGNSEYYQWCQKCEKDESYDITREPWYHKPCHVCRTPIEEKVNIQWNVDVCSTVCKYAYLAVNTSLNFTHIPTRIKHYIETKGCREHYLDVANAAERYYRRRHPNESLDYWGTTFHNQLSWIQMAREFADDLNDHWQTLVDTTPDSVEAETLRQSFDLQTQLLTERFTEMRDLTRDGRLGDRIRLCDECLLPFTIEELVEKDRKWLCIKTESNPNPCETDNSMEHGLNITTQPIPIPEKSHNTNNQ